MTFDSSFYDFLRKNFFNNTKSQDIHLSEVENTLKKVEKTSERNPSSVLDNLYALLATLAVRSAHDVGLVRLHLADLTAIEGEELAADDGIDVGGLRSDGWRGIGSDGNAETLGEGGLAIVDGDKDGAYPTLLRSINGDNGTVDGCRQQSALRGNGIGWRDGLAVLTVEACEVGFNVERAWSVRLQHDVGMSHEVEVVL